MSVTEGSGGMRCHVFALVIGVARIFSGGALFFLEKVDDLFSLFLVATLETQTKATN